jgi:16S rRNA (guanine966-N2)-methyltransferase
VRAIRANIAALRCADRCDVRAASVLTLGPARQPLDLVMLDPPYGTGAGAVAIERLARLGWIGEATWICLETAAKEIPDVRVCTLDAERKVGKALLSLMRLKA